MIKKIVGRCLDWCDDVADRGERRKLAGEFRVHDWAVKHELERRYDEFNDWGDDLNTRLKKTRPWSHFLLKAVIVGPIATISISILAVCAYYGLVVLFSIYFYTIRGFVAGCYALAGACQLSYEVLWQTWFLSFFNIVWPLLLNRPPVLPTPQFMSAYAGTDIYFLGADACLGAFSSVPCGYVMLCPPALTITKGLVVKAGLWALLLYMTLPSPTYVNGAVWFLTSWCGGIFAIYTVLSYCGITASTGCIGLFFGSAWRALGLWDWAWWLGFGLEQASVYPKYHTWLAEYLEAVHQESAFLFLSVVTWSFIVIISATCGPLGGIVGSFCVYRYGGYALFLKWAGLCGRKKCVVALDPQLDLGVRQAKAYVGYTAGYTQPAGSTAPSLTMEAALTGAPEVALFAAVALVIGFIIFRYGR